jgi:transcriptional regulator with XRE-family HTH domain
VKGCQLPAEVRAGLTTRRQVLGLSQRALAEIMESNQSTLSQLENGRSDPLVGTLVRWAEALGLRLTIGLEVNAEEKEEGAGAG